MLEEVLLCNFSICQCLDKVRSPKDKILARNFLFYISSEDFGSLSESTKPQYEKGKIMTVGCGSNKLLKSHPWVNIAFG